MGGEDAESEDEEPEADEEMSIRAESEAGKNNGTQPNRCDLEDETEEQQGAAQW